MSRLKKHTTRLLAALMLGALLVTELGPMQTAGAVEDVLAEFDFDDKENGLKSDNAIADGAYSLREHANGKALYLDGNDFLEVTKADGSSLLAGVDELTISMQAKPDRSNTNWLLYAAPNEEGQPYLYETYLGILDQNGNILAERYKNTGTRAETATAATGTEDWYYVTVVHAEGETILYIDGEEKARQTSAYSLTDILGENSILYIGKANWGSGEYYKGLIDNLKIQKRALSADEVKNQAEVYQKADKAALIAAIGESLPKTDRAKYTKETWSLYEASFATAKEINKETYANQKEVDAATKALTDAKAALSEKAVQAPVENIFIDVSKNGWYRDYVQFTYDESIMTGMTATTFAPSENLNRAQFAVILYRMEGEPAVEYKRVFDDVSDERFYTDAVLWASEAGIITGYDNSNCFGPADSICREQIAVMLYRYAAFKGYDMTKTSDMEGFADKSKVSEYAEEAMKWIVGQQIITGRQGNLLAPRGNATRAEIAAIIYRYQSMIDDNKNISFKSDYILNFEANDDLTIGIQILDPNGRIAYENDAPVELDIAGTNLSNGRTIANGYDQVEWNQGKWEAYARIKTSQGSILDITDNYYKSNNGVHIDRWIETIKQASDDYAYASRWSIKTVETGDSVEDYEYFIPSLFYKDTSNLSSGALFSSLPISGNETLAKETRAGLGMVMARNIESGDMISIAHITAGVSDEKSAEQQYTRNRCDETCKYGAIGITNKTVPGIVFRYPFAETPYSYTTGSNGQRAYHPIQVGTDDEYSLFLFAENTEDYNAAMTASYLSSFEESSPKVADVDMNKMYNIAQEDMLGYVQEKGTGIGLPFAAYVDDGSIFIDGGGTEAINFQMGFIGMQIPLAYQMMRYGMLNSDSDAWSKGVSIMNFWSDRCGTDSGVVKVWFDNYDFRPYPAFLRIMTDGMEGMLDAWMLANESGDTTANIAAWEEMICKYADFLVNAQNDDGSYYRAYDYSGNAFSDSNNDGLIGDANTHGESRLNSAVPIRFLIRMYEAFGDEAYLKAAEKAGGFVMGELYPQGKYVGGTADNPNTVDKEAGMYAVYAYSALYSATGEERYLEAMEQAVVYTFSWTYTYKMEVANPKNLVAGIASSNGDVDGLSIIAAGHSGADNMIAYMYYEFFKLYVWTGNEIYLEMADFIQNNTRQTMDLDGEYGLARKSFMIEATGYADMVFGTAGDRGIWLPWITCANIEPAANMEDTFGTKDVGEASQKQLEELRLLLKDYGAGGLK